MLFRTDVLKKTVVGTPTSLFFLLKDASACSLSFYSRSTLKRGHFVKEEVGDLVFISGVAPLEFNRAVFT